MIQAPFPWALLVVGNPSPPRDAPGILARIDPPTTVLGRALSLTSVAKTACLIEDRLRPQWNNVIHQLWSSNVVALRPGERVVEAVVERLEAIWSQEPAATVIVIPFNHCAVEELTWLDSAKGALRLGDANRNTVYVLHDSPHNDPRSALEKPEVCSSSVMVGSVAALLALCRGTRNTVVVDLAVGEPDIDRLAAFTDLPDVHGAAVNVVHLRLVEEYASLQRQDVWHRRSGQLDLHA